ncbi:hypothetical protein H0H93_009350 [Arthromyces matolae]|nr:hypothetical protein H0H93_009350 [Arthromyces matolae]
MTESHLETIGVANGRLVFNQDRIAKIAKHAMTHTRQTKAAIEDLLKRLGNIFDAVDTGVRLLHAQNPLPPFMIEQSETGFKMVVNEMLITLTTLPSLQEVAILPDREIEPEDVLVVHPVTGAHLSFGGTIDYVILESEPEHKDRSIWRRAMLVNLDYPMAPNYGMCGREIPLAVSKAIAFSVSLE